MRKFLSLILCVLVSLPALAAERKESAYDRVMRTNTIRCGYAVAPPWIYKDDKDGGKLKGFIVDITEEMGKRLNLKIDWAEETGWDMMGTALQTGRVDMGCTVFWQSAARGRIMAFSRPLFYSAVYAYARGDDKRFDNAYDRINQSTTRITVMDGDVSDEIAQQMFPNATRVSAAALSTPDMMMLNVATNKADVVFTENSYFNTYDKSNPGKMRRIPLATPLRVFGNAYPVYIKDMEMRSMVDTAVAEMMNSGIIESIMKPYMESDPGTFLIAQPSYKR